MQPEQEGLSVPVFTAVSSQDGELCGIPQLQLVCSESEVSETANK
jgi:hypothetical protein